MNEAEGSALSRWIKDSVAFINFRFRKGSIFAAFSQIGNSRCNKYSGNWMRNGATPSRHHLTWTSSHLMRCIIDHFGKLADNDGQRSTCVRCSQLVNGMVEKWDNCKKNWVCLCGVVETLVLMIRLLEHWMILYWCYDLNIWNVVKLFYIHMSYATLVVMLR